MAIGRDSSGGDLESDVGKIKLKSEILKPVKKSGRKTKSIEDKLNECLDMDFKSGMIFDLEI